MDINNNAHDAGIYHGNGAGENGGSGILFMITSIMLLIFGAAMFCVTAIFFLIGKTVLGDEQSALQNFILLACGFTSVIVGVIGLSANEDRDKADIAVQFGYIVIAVFVLNLLVSIITNGYFASLRNYINERDHFQIVISVVLNFILPLLLPILYCFAASKNKKSLT